MPVADLLRDPAVRNAARRDPVRGLTKDFVLRRVRQLIREDPALRDPATAGDLTVDGTVVVGARLAVELPRVQDAQVEMGKRIAADPAHLDLTRATNLTRTATRPPLGPQKMRQLLVASIVYQAAAVDITLADPAAVDRLNVLCDRRLRAVERMLYDVGGIEPAQRRFSRAQLTAHPAGPWPDGFDRSFEAPQVPQRFFLEACDRDVDGVCSPPMIGWRVRGLDDIFGPLRTNPATTGAWLADPNDPRQLDLLYQPGSLDVIAATERLFTPSTDVLGRNLLGGDQVIHALALESLVFSRQKRVGRPGGPPDASWLEAERTGKPAGWLRLSSPFRGHAVFLAGRHEPAHFDHVAVRQADLQPGDHVLVHNHAAYANATVAGIRTLGTALVVQTHPRLLLQGHGSQLRDLGATRQEMVERFNDELDQRRAEVEGMATVTGAAGPNQVRVNTVKRLREGMAVELADPRRPGDPGIMRFVVGIDHATRTVRYDSRDLPSVRAGWVLRRQRQSPPRGFPEIAVDGVTIRRRLPTDQASEYAGRHERADWFLSWDVVDVEERALRSDSAKAAQRAFVHQHQLVEYTVNHVEGEPKTWGWFPLWRPALRGRAPRRVDGLIVDTKEVRVKPDQVAGWTWFMDPGPARRDLVPVLRPREP